MKVHTGDLWDWHAQGHWIVVTTNIGWDDELHNNMGAGVALQAAIRFPGLSRQYGELCSELGADTPVTPHMRHRLFLFPVKPLLADPEYSWHQLASLQLIERSAKQLAALIDTLGLRGKVAMAFPGCGNGKLNREDVAPILDRYLADRVVLVERASDEHSRPPSVAPGLQ